VEGRRAIKERSIVGQSAFVPVYRIISSFGRDDERGNGRRARGQQQRVDNRTACTTRYYQKARQPPAIQKQASKQLAQQQQHASPNETYRRPRALVETSRYHIFHHFLHDLLVRFLLRLHHDRLPLLGR